MIYSVNISSDNITTEKIIDKLNLYNNFTLTANAVNDAPVMLQPLEYLEIVEASGAASVVQSTVFDYLAYPTFKLL